MATKAENWIAICPASRLASQTIICVRLDTMDFLLVREGDQVFACERACPHEQADLSLGHVANGRLFCPRHLASFDLHDGNISDGWARSLCEYFLRGSKTNRSGLIPEQSQSRGRASAHH